MGGITYNKYTFALLILIITILAAHEFFALSNHGKASPQKALGFVAITIFFVSNALVAMQITNIKILLINIPFIFSFFIAELFTKADKPFNNIAYMMLCLVYIVFPFTLLHYTAYAVNGEFQSSIILGFFYLLWASDTGAYLSGMAFGRTKLFERISPKKSWEGFIGGAVLSLLVAYILSQYFTILPFKDWAIIAVIIIIAGTLGDLVESLFKRSIDIKDSGTMLPGHGGILDRFDGLLLAAPFVFVYLFLIWR